MATPGAERHLGGQSHVAIIVDDDRLACHALQPLGKRNRSEVDIAARQDRTAPRIDAAGNADADGLHIRCAEKAHHVGDAAKHQFRVGGAFLGNALEDFTGGGDAGGTQICAANIDSYAERHGVLHVVQRSYQAAAFWR